MQEHARTARHPLEKEAARAASPFQRFIRFKIGIMPMPLYLVAVACLISFVLRGKVPTDLCIMAVVLSACAYTLAEIGHRVPLFRSLGGAVILNTFLPSALVFYGLMPAELTKSIGLFFKQSNFLYLFVAAVVVGSIFSMERKTLLANIVKIVIPLVISSVAATVVGLGVGLALGLSVEHTLFYILAPIMAGGVGEGAVPLAIGYAAILHGQQSEVIGQILPIVALSNVVAIVIAGLLHTMGQRRAHLTGNGLLLLDDKSAPLSDGDSNDDKSLLADIRSPAVAGLTLLTLYAVAVALEHAIDLPAPLIMLMLAVVMKMAHMVPPAMEQGTRWVYRFFALAGTYPLMFCVGVVLTPWKPMVAAFTPATCITIVCTVVALAATGFFVARWCRMYPVETAIITVCHAGSGGTGDVAILGAGKRLGLMATAQVSTKIGGFVTVTLALLTFSHFH